MSEPPWEWLSASLIVKAMIVCLLITDILGSTVIILQLQIFVFLVNSFKIIDLISISEHLIYFEPS